jgi:hypothetical protein
MPGDRPHLMSNHGHGDKKKSMAAPQGHNNCRSVKKIDKRLINNFWGRTAQKLKG